MKKVTSFLVVSLSILLGISKNAWTQVKPDGSAPGGSGYGYSPAAYNSNARINYVRTWEPWMPITDASQVPSQTVANVKMSTAYVDGLGRPIQTVTKQITPLQKDMVAAKVFDDYGRESYQFLPHVSTLTDGYFKTNPIQEQQTYYSTGSLNNNQYAGEVVYYGMTKFEPSPLNRPDTVMAPGNSWTGQNRAIITQHLLNTASEAIRVWKINDAIGSVPSSDTIYKSAELIKTVITDEHSKQVIEYKNKEGHVILKKVQLAGSPGTDHSGWLCTYYVYDDYGLLRTVIQPRGVELLAAASWSISTSIFEEQCFRYEYDTRNRMIIKRVPGAGEVWMVYDARDRLVMTQDANLRAINKWLVTQYDAADRPTVTGLLSSTDNRATHQTAAWSSTSYPGSVSEELTVTYYDYYTYSGVKSWDNADIGYLSEGSNPYPETVAKADLTYGSVTGGKTKVLGSSSQYMIATSYYDEKVRVIQVLADNVNGGTDVTTNQYDFTGKPLSNYLKHNNPSATQLTTIRILTKMLYDHAGRPIKTWKQLNNSGTDKLIAENSYDELGQLKSKVLSPTGGAGGNPIETLNYEYNIRGWLLAMNKDYVNNVPNVTRWFGQTLSYDFGFTSKLYNGNIAGIQWRSKGDAQQRAFGFTYDAVNRLTQADFTQWHGGSNAWNTNAGLDFTASNLTYDANGNIATMNQKGWKISGSTLIDQMSYTYETNSNRLKQVTDAVNDNNSKLGDFKYDASTKTSTDYTYDVNGNMTVDNNKKISSITYNHLNLPNVITVTGKGTITYTYDATGNKLKKATVEGSTTTTTTYIAGFVYENNVFQHASHEEGRIRRKPDSTYVFDYFIKDHLGNVRMVLTEEQKTDTYPLASMETAQASVEETFYSNLPATRTNIPQGYPNDPYTDPNQKVAKVSGAQGTQKIGPAIMLKVMAGDKYNLRVSSWWNGTSQPDNPVSAFNDIVAALSGGIANLTTTHGSGSTIQNSGVLSPAVTTFLSRQNDLSQSGRPRAYINWILLDEQFNVVGDDIGVEQVGAGTSTEDRDGSSGPFSVHQRNNLTITKSGYLYIYVSNETPNIDVFFDNLQVTHIRGQLLEETHYYPFGLAMNGISSKALKSGYVENNKKFNGYELNREFDINLYESFYRMNDPQLGRFWQIDPKPNEILSPYSSMGNNPITLNDPLGDTTYYYGPGNEYYGRLFNKGPETVVIIEERFKEKFQGYHDNNFKDFKGRKVNDVLKEFGRYGVTYDAAGIGKFFDDNKGKTKVKTVDGTSIDEMKNPTYNGKSVTKSFLKNLDAEMLGNLVFKNGVVSVGTGRHSDQDLISNSPAGLPYEEGQVAHIHNHQTMNPFTVIWNTSTGNFQSSKTVSANPGAGPSPADYSRSVHNMEYRNVVVDQKYIYFITGFLTVKHPR